MLAPYKGPRASCKAAGPAPVRIDSSRVAPYAPSPEYPMAIRKTSSSTVPAGATRKPGTAVTAAAARATKRTRKRPPAPEKRTGELPRPIATFYF